MGGTLTQSVDASQGLSEGLSEDPVEGLSEGPTEGVSQGPMEGRYAKRPFEEPCKATAPKP